MGGTRLETYPRVLSDCASLLQQVKVCSACSLFLGDSLVLRGCVPQLLPASTTKLGCCQGTYAEDMPFLKTRCKAFFSLTKAAFQVTRPPKDAFDRISHTCWCPYGQDVNLLLVAKQCVPQRPAQRHLGRLRIVDGHAYCMPHACFVYPLLLKGFVLPILRCERLNAGPCFPELGKSVTVFK
jgi:hypothetical protein